MLFFEEVAYDLRLPLSAAQVTAHAGHQLGPIAGSAFAETVGLDVLVQKFIRIELRAVPCSAWRH